MAIPILVRCECGETSSTDLGEPVDCVCGRHYDTSQLAEDRFTQTRTRQARIRLYLRIGLIFIAGAVATAAVLWGIRGVMIALPLAALMWFLFLGKWFRKRWLLRDKTDSTSVTLEASDP